MGLAKKILIGAVSINFLANTFLAAIPHLKIAEINKKIEENRKEFYSQPLERENINRVAKELTWELERIDLQKQVDRYMERAFVVGYAVEYLLN